MDHLAVEQIGLERDCLKGQVAVVTGAGRGIGKEVARAMAWLGARVVIAELSDSGIEVERMIRDLGGDATFVRTDVSDLESIDHLIKETQSIYGTADILINNAILCPVCSVMEMPVDTWDRTLAVNLRGTFLACRAFLPGMLGARRGAIVNMVSAEAMPYLSAYIASKQGIQAFSESLAGEVGESGIKVVSFAPGMVDTPAIREMSVKLAPHMGLTPDQFMGMSLHPAYPGLMPAEHAGAATAYLVARLMDRYHGESVTGYEVLETAGFISPTGGEATVSEKPDQPMEMDRKANMRSSELTRQFQKVIAETEAELNKLPVFVRPLARRGFMGKSGKSLQEWGRIAGSLVAWADCNDAAQRSLLRNQTPGLEELLEKLSGYYRDTPAETARFTRDQALLAEVKRISEERVQLIQDLISLLT